MPIYEYVCTACGRRIDVVHGIHAEGPSVCDACGGAMKKALTAPAIHFKGSGWAKKDARAAATPVAAAGAAKDAAPATGDAPAPGGEAGGGDAPSTGDGAPASSTPPVAAPAATAPAATAPATSTTGS